MTVEIINNDCLEILPELGSFNCIFLDPPDNIGLKYDGYKDRRSDGSYVAWLQQVLIQAKSKAPVIWLSFNAKWGLDVGAIVWQDFLDWDWKPCVQTFTFGQHNHHDFGNCHRPLWRLSQPDAPFYPDHIRVPSWRQQNGDKRADPRGRVPGDVFDFPRVTGNSRQRKKWHPTQLHEGLIERCILSCTKPGDWVLDPMAGTGTTGRACQQIGRNCVMIEISEKYCEKIERDLFYREIDIDGTDTTCSTQETRPAKEAPPAGPRGSEEEAR